MQDIFKDLRFAVRQLQKNPGFACTAIFMLTLGVCASAAIFAFADAALIRPLPYRNPSRLVSLYETNGTVPRMSLSYLDYLDWKKYNRVFRSMAAYGGSGGWGFTLATAGGEQHVAGMQVSDTFFPTLGVTPTLGRGFHAGEDLPSAPNTVLLSYSAWQKRFGGRNDVLGHSVTLNGIPSIVIGVLPRDFHFAPAGAAEFWTTLRQTRACEQRRDCHSVLAVARLTDGVSAPMALADMKTVAHQLARQYPDSNRDEGANVISLSDSIVGDIRPILLVLLGGAGLLLLIACLNVASLLLARSDSRMREIAVRNALGASRARLLQQFAAEAMVLVGMGSLFGLLSAEWGIQFLIGLIPAGMMDSMPYLHGLGVNFHVAAFACAVSLIAAVVFALTPIARVSLFEMLQGLKEGSRGSAGAAWRRFGSNLVVVELAIAVVLLVGAGLLGKSLYRLLQVDIGFHADHLATLQVAPPPGSEEQQFIALERQAIDRLSGLPGVQAVGVTDQLPLGYGWSSAPFDVMGRPEHGEHTLANQLRVSSGYFHTLQAQVVRGHAFTEAEAASKRPILLINQTMAKQYFPGQNPIGQQIYYHDLPQTAMQIVGVIADIQEGALGTPATPAVYVPFEQKPNDNFIVVVRTAQAEESLFPSLAAALRRIEPGLSIYDQVTMSQKLNQSPSAYLHRSSAWLVGGFAAVAFLLGVIGIYGVVAYSVSQRTREIGVRMALGAEPRSVYQLILKEAAWLAGFGTAIGIVCALAAATTIRRMLFGVHSWDVPTLVGVAGVLILSALVASYLPARRAALVNPVEALRME